MFFETIAKFDTFQFFVGYLVTTLFNPIICVDSELRLIATVMLAKD